jgi:hypothetical protein
MSTEDLIDVVRSLTAEEQVYVKEFIDLLREKSAQSSPFLEAAEEFIERHPDFLRRLAQ